MLRAIAVALPFSLILLLGGCERSLEAPATEVEANFKRAATAAHVHYTDMSRSAVEARRQANQLSDKISFVRVSHTLGVPTGNPPTKGAFSSIDREARSLINEYRGTPIGPPLAENISIVMLTSLVHPDAQRALPEEKRHAAIAYYVRTSIENYGRYFDDQLRALEALGPDRASAVKPLAQRALSNLEGLKVSLHQPIEIPTWMQDEMQRRMTSAEIRAERQDWDESRQRRLEQLKENRIQERLETLAGWM